MRKFALLAALLLASASFTVSLSEPAAAIDCAGELGCPPIPPKQSQSQPGQPGRSTNHTGALVVGCGIASAASLMVGTQIHASHKNKKLRRQLTITEATWYASACPFLLPLALIAQANCPDNKATYTIATLAYRYVERHPGGDQSAFTNAFGEACRTHKLSAKTLAQLGALVRG